MRSLIYFFLILFTFSCTQDSSFLISGNSSGTLSGSYATMLPIDGFLYVINETDIFTYDIADTESPILVDEQNVGFEIESMYHHEGVLFVGSSEALHIFVIQENGIPLRKSETVYNFDNLEEWGSCDPVVADDTYAYVTLRSSTQEGFGCNAVFRVVNELRIYNIENLQEPELLTIRQMDFPKGLAITGDYLFVCEGNLGVKLFDVSDRMDPIEIWSDEGFETFDIILKDGLMMVVGPDAIRQYDYTDINNIEYLTAIEF